MRIFGPSRHEEYLEQKVQELEQENRRLWSALTGGRVQTSVTGPAQPVHPGLGRVEDPAPLPAPAGNKPRAVVPRRTMHQVQTALEMESRRNVAQADSLRKKGILDNEKAIAVRQQADAFEKRAHETNERIAQLANGGTAPHPTELADPVEEAFEAFGEN